MVLNASANVMAEDIGETEDIGSYNPISNSMMSQHIHDQGNCLFRIQS